MAAIILGSNPITQNVGLINPIIIPVDTMPLRGITILQNPLILRSSDSVSTVDSNWTRLSGSLLRPKNITDSIVIGTSSLLGSERLRVNGDVLASNYLLDGSTRLSIDNSGNLLFTDSVSGDVTLASLLASGGTVLASGVSIVDSGEYFTSVNVEGALAELGLIQHYHNNLGLLDTYAETQSNLHSAVLKTHDLVTLGTSNGLSLNSQILSLQLASTATTGALSNTDWNTFNDKQDLLTVGNLTESTSSVLTITGGTGSIIGSGITIRVKQANATTSGYLSSTDWNTFNNKTGGITLGTANGLTLDIQELSLDVADTDTTGALSSTDWNTFNGKIDSTDTVEAIKDLVLSEASLIYGVDSITAGILPKGSANQILAMNGSADAIEWIDNTGGATNADTVDFKHASGTMNSSITSYIDPTTGDNIVDHIDYLYALTSALTSGRTWKAPVTNFADLATTYPSPSAGWSALVTADNSIYTYTGSTWVKTNGAVPALTNSISGIVDSSWYDALNDFTAAYNGNPTDNTYLNKDAFESVDLSNLSTPDSTVTVGIDKTLKLNGGTNVTLSSIGDIITIDADGGGDTYTFSEGLIESGGDVVLGGTINTTVLTTIGSVSAYNLLGTDSTSTIYFENATMLFGDSGNTGSSGNYFGLTVNSDNSTNFTKVAIEGYEDIDTFLFHYGLNTYGTGTEAVLSLFGGSSYIELGNTTRINTGQLFVGGNTNPAEYMDSPTLTTDNQIPNKKYVDDLVNQKLYDTYTYYRDTLDIDTAGDIRVSYNATGRYTEQYNGSTWDLKEEVIW